MPIEITGADIKVGLLTFALVASIGGFAVATAEPREAEPPRPPDPALIEKCARTILPNLCMYLEGVGFPDGRSATEPPATPSTSPRE